MNNSDLHATGLSFPVPKDYPIPSSLQKIYAQLINNDPRLNENDPRLNENIPIIPLIPLKSDSDSDQYNSK
jgi:hypothetical protein